MKTRHTPSPHRGEQISEVVHRTVSEALVREVDIPFGSFVTVSRVELDPERKHATVFLTVLPDSVALSTFRKVQNQIGVLQHQLNTHLRIKPVPRLHVTLDKGEDKRHRMDRLLDELQQGS